MATTAAGPPSRTASSAARGSTPRLIGEWNRCPRCGLADLHRRWLVVRDTAVMILPRVAARVGVDERGTQMGDVMQKSMTSTLRDAMRRAYGEPLINDDLGLGMHPVSERHQGESTGALTLVPHAAGPGSCRYGARSTCPIDPSGDGKT